MSIQVADKIIETDAEGYLIDPNDWSEAVAEANRGPRRLIGRLSLRAPDPTS